MMRTAIALFLLPVVATVSFAVAPPLRDQWIVVTAPAFQKALEPLIQHRRAEGQHVVVVDSTSLLSAADVRVANTVRLRAHLRKLCKDHKGVSRILLVGSVLPVGANAHQTCVPALRGSISRMLGQPSDVGYGCLDESRLPTVAVGRFPARTVEEVKGFVTKTLAMETESKPGAWRRRLTVLAGIPAYNAIVDRLLENLAFTRFDGINPTWTGQAVYTNMRSRFALPAKQLRNQSLAYIRQGQAFILYLGHSDASGLYGGPMLEYLNRRDWGSLRIDTGGSVFVTFGCNGCQLAGFDGEGYGIAAVRNPHGPAAVIGSHGICFAAMVQLAAEGLVEQAFQKELPLRIGDCYLTTLAGVAKGRMDFLTYRMLDQVDGDPKIPQATQRQEHLEMFLLLGDPALKLPRMAQDIQLQAPRFVTPGETITIRGTLPPRLSGAEVQVRLQRTPGSEPVDVGEIKPTDSDEVRLARHRQANNFRVTTAKVGAQGRSFEVTLKVPTKTPWATLHLRVYAATKTAEGMGVERLRVVKRSSGEEKDK